MPLEAVQLSPALYRPGTATALQRRHLMNDVIDELAWSDARLARVAGTPNSFIESGALEDYRNYIGGIRYCKTC